MSLLPFILRWNQDDAPKPRPPVLYKVVDQPLLAKNIGDHCDRFNELMASEIEFLENLSLAVEIQVGATDSKRFFVRVPAKLVSRDSGISTNSIIVRADYTAREDIISYGSVVIDKNNRAFATKIKPFLSGQQFLNEGDTLKIRQTIDMRKV